MPHASRIKLADTAFTAGLAAAAGGYLLLLVLLVAADLAFLSATPAGGGDQTGGNQNVSDQGGGGLGGGGLGGAFAQAWADPNIRYAVRLTLVSCTLSTVLAMLVAVPAGYLFSRSAFRAKPLLDTLMDIPIVLPPLTVGLSLLILLQLAPAWLQRMVVYQPAAVVLAQFVVAAALAVRTMRAAFDQIDPRLEQVARTLGATRAQAFGWVTLAEARPGMITAATLAWARSLGEFGPLLVFAGATRGKTEVLATTVYLELSAGNLRGAVAVSLMMIATAVVVLTAARLLHARWGRVQSSSSGS
ncbi:MAG: ABC transporter permease [Planctomycetota bacterium]